MVSKAPFCQHSEPIAGLHPHRHQDVKCTRIGAVVNDCRGARIRHHKLNAIAVDRVSTVSSERGRAVKLSITGGRLVLSVTNPDSGSATEEIEVQYAADPLDIGFNSRYLLDIAAQLEGEAAVLKLADPGSPTLIQDRDTKGALYVLMPMRV